MKHLISQWISVFLLICLAACNLPESAAGVPVSGGARTWFDAPLDGTSLRLAPYPVVIHTYDPGGVAQVEFSVNGVVLENLKLPPVQGCQKLTIPGILKRPGILFYVRDHRDRAEHGILKPR